MLANLVFLNPMTMMIGGLLIASPIIIHLINRMRFKRIRWAAMEFLLKAQKRSRRRLIIEQMILLLLRILLILLVALLLSRLIDKQPDKDIESAPIDKEPPKSTLHVIIMDDSASMGERWRQDEGADRGKETTGFDQAGRAVREFIVDIVKDDINPHEFTIIKTSDPEHPKVFTALNDSVRAEIDTYLKESTVQPRHFEINTSLNKAKDLLLEAKTKNLVLHVISDFRATDWNDAAKDSLGKVFEQLEKATVQVKMHDVIPPKREQDRVQSAENLAIVDFRPESSVVTKDTPVEFTVTVANYSNSDKTIQVRIKVNNEDRAEGSIPMTIPPNGTVTGKAVLTLSRTTPKDLNNKPETAKYDGFNLISAQISNQTTGLAIDDLRYTVVEVRDSVSLLLVDNNVLDRGKKTSESFYLWKLFSDTYRGFTVDIRTPAEMEKLNLNRYSAVVLCDIPLLTAPAIQKLEAYLNSGGGVGFFMGSSIRDPKLYNDLYKEGKGMFPVPLKEVANKNATTDQLNQILFDQRISLNKKLLIREEIRKHPAMEKLYYDSRGQLADKIIENLYYGVCIARYYIVDRSKWNPGEDTKTLLYLPNNRSIADFEKQTKDLLKKLRETTDIASRRTQLQQRFDETKDEERRQEIQKQIENLPQDFEKFAKYAKTIREYSDIISNTVGKYDNPLHKLVVWMDVLMEDPGDPNAKPPLPSMVEFWQIPEKDIQELKQEFRQLQDVIKFGDPFYIAKQYRRGRVLAFMGAAGTSGPEGDYWSSLRESGAGYFPILMKDSLQRWLCAASGDLYMPLGAPFDFELEAASYEPIAVSRNVANNDSLAVDADKVIFGPAVPANLEVVADSPVINWQFTGGNKPGMYLFEFSPKNDPTKKETRTDIRALAYNFDTRIESNLLRARTDDLTTIARVSKIEALDEASKPRAIARESEKELKKEEGDLGWSKSPWMYLGLLLALIFEQAMAVRLSFHIRGNASGPAIPQAVTRGPVVA